MGFRYFSDVIMMVDLESICFPESSLQQRVRELEGAQVIRGTSSMAELGRLRKERDDLKEAVNNFETELMQVCTLAPCVCCITTGVWYKYVNVFICDQIQADTKALAEDRDNFKLLYEQVYYNMHVQPRKTCICTYSLLHQEPSMN